MLLPTLPSVMAFQAFSQGVSSVTGDAGERSPEALPVFFIFVIVAHGVDKALGQSVDHVRHHQGRGRRPIVLMALPRFWLFCS